VASAAERPRAGRSISPARRCAYRVIRRVFEQGAYADRAFHAEATGLDSRDRALAMQLAYGTVQRKRTLDHVLIRLSTRPPNRLEPAVLASLRLGLFQLAFLSGIPERAAVHESVELAKQHSHGGAGLVNAVLRRATRELDELLSDLTDETPDEAALKQSVPDWLAEMWWKELGPDEARKLLNTINLPPESALRINALRARDPNLPVPSRPDPDLPEARILDGPFDVFESDLYKQGQVMPQSRGSMHVARSLAPLAGERVLDACAAPGAKTTHLAALMQNEGQITAVEIRPHRAQALKELANRMAASCVKVVQGDARALPESEGSFDRVLLDPPCSGLGTLQSRPDLRWQPGRADIDGLAEQQRQLLNASAAALSAGGTLVYSVCTISRREGPDLIRSWLAEHEKFQLEHERQLLPHHDGTDGFYIARLVRG
jgi:16S rRNA (cytosine967-C5)-methyltransferase